MNEEKIILDLQVKAGDALQTIVETKEQLQALRKEQKELEKDIRNGKGTVETRERLKQVTGEIANLNNVLRVNQKELQNQVKLQNEQAGSIKAMRAELQQMRSEYESLSASDRAGSRGVELQQQIKQLTESLKELEFAQGDFTRGVGEYERALSGNARTALREMRMECQNLAVTLNGLQGELTAQTEVVAKVAQTYGTSSQEYQEASNELARLQAAYDKTSSSLQTMEQRTGELADVIADSNQRVNSFANDQQKIVAAQEGVNALTSAYDALQGAMTLIGKDSSALVEVYSKMQIVQRSVNGLLTIYKSLNKDSNLMIVARQKIEKLQLVWQRAYNQALAQTNTLTKTNTAGTVAATTANTAATASTVSLTAGVRALGIALKANPLTAVAAAAVAAVSALTGAVRRFVSNRREAEQSLAESAERAKQAELDYANSIKSRVDAQKSITSSIDKEIVKTNTLVSVLKSETSTYSAKQNALKELNRLIPTYNGLLDRTGKLVSGNEQALKDYVKGLEERAKQEVAIESLKEQQLELLTLKRQKRMAESDRQWYESQVNSLQGYMDALRQGGNYEEVARVSNDLDWYEKKLTQTINVINTLNGSISQVNRSIGFTVNSLEDIDFNTVTKQTKQVSTNVKTSADAFKEFAKAVESSKKGNDVGLLANLLAQADELTAKFPELKTKVDELKKDLQGNIIAGFEGMLQTQETPEVEQIAARYDSIIARLEKLKETYPELVKQVDELVKKFGSEKDLKINESLTRTQQYVDSIVNGFKSMNIFETFKIEMDKINQEEANSLLNVNLSEEQKQAIREAYAQKRLALEVDLQNKIKELEGGLVLDSQPQNIFQQIQRERDARLQAAMQTRNELLANEQLTADERLKIQQDYAAKVDQINVQTTEQTTVAAMDSIAMLGSSTSSLMGAMGDLFSVLAEDNEDFQKYANAMALVQMATQMAVGIATATAQAMTIPFPGNIAAAITGAATVVSAITTAITQIKKNKVKKAPKFADGGLVGNRITNRTDDTIPAMLSEGEYVIRSSAVKAIGVDRLNQINLSGMIPKQEPIDYDRLAEAVSQINMSVSVKEINDVQNRIKVKENY